jgi:hypothetical protein
MMTEQQLARYEARYRSHLRIMLAFDELQELTAEIRRSWDEIKQLKADLNETRSVARQFAAFAELACKGITQCNAERFPWLLEEEEPPTLGEVLTDIRERVAIRQAKEVQG